MYVWSQRCWADLRSKVTVGMTVRRLSAGRQACTAIFPEVFFWRVETIFFFFSISRKRRSSRYRLCQKKNTNQG